MTVFVNCRSSLSILKIVEAVLVQRIFVGYFSVLAGQISGRIGEPMVFAGARKERMMALLARR